MVSKGAVPRTRKEKLTMVQSCNFTLLDPCDFSKRMTKSSYPLVIVYNGRDHYVPTTPTSYEEFYKWKTEKELAPILSAGLLVLEELDLNFLSPQQVTACNELEAVIVKHLPTLSEKVNAAHHAMVARAPGKGTRGPVFHQPRALKVPPPSAQPDPQPSQSTSSSATVSTEPPAPPEIAPPPAAGKKPKEYICDMCGVKKTRKPALVGHMWVAHGLGEPIKCEHCDKGFTQKSSLTKHIKTIHHKQYKYKCPDCYWGSNDRHELVTHRKRHHGKVLREKGSGERRQYVCKDCKKTFDGPNLLRKHRKRETCMAKKKHQCPECLKMYITLAKRDEHFRQHHTPGAQTWVCQKCQKVLHSLSASLNHEMWHRGLGVLARARAIRQRKIQTEAMKATSKHLAKKLPHVTKKKKRTPVGPKARQPRVEKIVVDVTKSAPPKIIPRRSPRKAAGKSKKK